MGRALNKFIQSECANSQKTRGCLGLDHAGTCFNSTGECLAMKGKHCPYFAESVLGPPDYRYYPRGYDMLWIRQEYSKIAAGQQPILDNLKTCNKCGRPVPKRRRLCNDCGRDNRLASKRSYKRERGRRR